MISEELYNTTLTKVRELISEETGNDFEEIVPEMFLEEELEIAESNLAHLIKTINTNFNIQLNATEIEEEESVKTVKQLAVVVAEEIELG
jgi:acyl carrier protein